MEGWTTIHITLKNENLDKLYKIAEKNQKNLGQMVEQMVNEYHVQKTLEGF